MASIARWNPSSNVTRFDPLDDAFDDLFRGFFLRPMNLGSRMMDTQVQFRVDVTEDEKEYHVLADLPGVSKEDINVTVDGDEVTISAETKQEKEIKDKAGSVLRSERFYGKLQRAFALGGDVDEARVQAKYIDGVLDLRLPKAAGDKSKKRKIDIH